MLKLCKITFYQQWKLDRSGERRAVTLPLATSLIDLLTRRRLAKLLVTKT